MMDLCSKWLPAPPNRRSDSSEQQKADEPLLEAHPLKLGQLLLEIEAHSHLHLTFAEDRVAGGSVCAERSVRNEIYAGTA